MADTKIKDLTEKATGEATDEFLLNDVDGGNVDKKMGMDGIRITASQTTDFNAAVQTNKIDDLTVADDNTDLDATTLKHGLMPKADKSKLDGIESSATTDQSNTEIKTAYEANADTNEYDDAEQTKLAGIASLAEVNPDLISQVDAEAGTATDERLISAERMKQAIDALGGGGGGNTFARVVKKADETITNDATFSDDSELTFSASANKTYGGIIIIIFDSDITPDFKWQMTGPTDATAVISNVNWSSVNEGLTKGLAVSTSVNIADTSIFFLAINFNVKNLTNAGTVAFQWAQKISNATATTVQEGSYLVVWEEV